MSSTITAEVAIKAAKKIGNYDFRTAVSCYTTGEDSGPWIITVGESNWRRHLVVMRTMGTEDNDVELGILPEAVSNSSVINMADNRRIEKIVLLSDLIAAGFVGIKRMLKPII